MATEREMTEGVSLVICVHNGAGRIVKTLEHIQGQEVPADISWEVIIVDNASADDTAGIASTSWKGTVPMRIVTEPARGITHAREKGIREARFEYVSFIDDDNWIAPDWVAVVYQMFRGHPEMGMCGGNNEAVFETVPPDWFHPVQGCFAVGEQAPGTEDVTDKRGYLWGAGLSVRRSLYLAIREAGFDYHTLGRVGDRLSAGDDTELSLAFVASGTRLWYCSGLNLKHFMPAGRLRWVHAVGIFRGLGESEIVVDLYRKAIASVAFPVFRIYLSLIFYIPVYFGWRFLHPSAGREGNPRYLSYIARKYYIAAAIGNLFTIRRKYRVIRHFCRNAKGIGLTISDHANP